jgi:hypothetical protein
MAVLSKAEALAIIRRSYGPDFAQQVEDRLPDHLDPEDSADIETLFRLGITREGLLEALGGDA